MGVAVARTGRHCEGGPLGGAVRRNQVGDDIHELTSVLRRRARMPAAPEESKSGFGPELCARRIFHKRRAGSMEGLAL